MQAQDGYDLKRFVEAQKDTYASALAELQAGRKRTHWIWFIFPQIAGLGRSEYSIYYSIKNALEARAYLEHPTLGPRLLECAQALLAWEERSALEILGSPDDLKFRSCMTLFANVSGPGSVFARVLEKYFDGQPDRKTLDLLEEA
jgi:uncharacterized protein (DUF1810 family)